MTQQTNCKALCAEQLPELRGMFERILCIARSSGGPAVGNIQLADRLIDAVVSWSGAALAQPEPTTTNPMATKERDLIQRLTNLAAFELGKRGLGCELLAEAKNYLAQPEPEGLPEDEELLEVAAKALGYKSIPSDETCLTAEAGELLAYGRAVWALASQATTTIEPEGPTDEEAREWYSYCPEDGMELHSSKESAQKAAQEIMGCYAKAAYSDGWHEDMESVSWGTILPVEQAQVVERTKAEPDSGFDEWVQYALVPVRYARPTIEPVPVSERRWEREGWCDAEGRCWWWCHHYESWVLDDGPAHYQFSLPHHALPVPTTP